MHELQVTESILEIVLKHAKMNSVERVLSVSLRIGEMSDLEDEWMQRYFDYLSRGTLAENAKLKIERTPVVMACDECGRSFEVDMKKMEEIQCPDCGGGRYTLVSGRDYYIKDMEVL